MRPGLHRRLNHTVKYFFRLNLNRWTRHRLHLLHLNRQVPPHPLMRLLLRVISRHILHSDLMFLVRPLVRRQLRQHIGCCVVDDNVTGFGVGGSVLAQFEDVGFILVSKCDRDNGDIGSGGDWALAVQVVEGNVRDMPVGLGNSQAVGLVKHNNLFPLGYEIAYWYLPRGSWVTAR
jgi:hypothetical protein